MTIDEFRATHTIEETQYTVEEYVEEDGRAEHYKETNTTWYDVSDKTGQTVFTYKSESEEDLEELNLYEDERI